MKDNYFKVVSKIYPISKIYTKSVKKELIITEELKQYIVSTVGADAYILYEYYFNKRNVNNFNPNDDKKIGNLYGWSKRKVQILKKRLKDNELLLILKDRLKDGSILYRILLDKVLIRHYKETRKINTAIIKKNKNK